MEVYPRVKTGMPLFFLQYNTIYLILICSVLGCACGIGYSLVLFTIASNIKRNLGDYISMVTSDGFLLSFLTAFPGLFVIAVNVPSIYFLIQAMYKNSTRDMKLNKALFILCILCYVSAILALGSSIVALSHSHSKNERLHDSIRDAMDNYALDSTIKRKLDLLQVTFQCCGSKTYTEWYEIKWFDSNFIDNRQLIQMFHWNMMF